VTIQVTALPSGLRVASDSMASVETVSLGVWVGVGTRNERAEVNGVAHLVEHMLFKGTERRSAFAISEQIETVGGHLNAYTTREQTAYYAKVLKEDVPLALDIVADMLQHSLFDAEELARERTVVLQEIGQANDTPDDAIFDHFQAAAYPDQAIGRPVLGTPEIIGSLARSALVDYLSGHYGAPGMVLTVAGRIDHERLVELAETAFDKLSQLDRAAVEPARYRGGDVREQRDLEQLHLVIGFDGVGYHEPDYYAHAVMSTLLGGGMSSRLFQEVREKRGLVYSIHSFTGAYLDGGLFGVYAGTSPEQAGELVPIVCEEICRLAVDATDGEVERSRAQLKSSILMALESTSARAEQLSQQLLIFGRPIPTDEILEKLGKVDTEAVRLAAGRLRASRPTVAALGPVGGLEDYERIVQRLA
jgi:predicted Zn-dependent peptidase